MTVTGVADGDKSNESVRITNQVTGSGLTMAPPVDVIVLDTPSTAPTTPSTPSTAPTNLRLTATDEQIRVRWDEPDAPVGRPVTRYEVQWKSAGAGDEDWQGVTLVNTVHTTYVISWLDNGTKYEVRVRAASSLGLGSWAEATVTTPRTGDQSPVREDRNLDLYGTDKPRSTPTPASASGPAQEPPGKSAPAQEPSGKKDFKTCVGGRDCNNSGSPYYWKNNPNSWK